MNSTTIQLVILFLLLISSSFFSAAETALMSLSRIRLRQMIEEKVKKADTVDKLLNQPSKLLGAILIGNNIVNIGASSLATSLAISYFGSPGIGIATGSMTFLVLIFGEITPKTLAAENAEKVSLAVVDVIHFLTIVFGPLLVVVLKLTGFFVKLLGGQGESDRPFVTEEELKMMVTVGHEEGILEKDEKKMLHNVFEFGDAQVRSVMTPRMDMEVIEIDSTYEEIVSKFKESQHSRIPVYEESIDNIIGIVYLKDLFFLGINKGASQDGFKLIEHLRKPYFTYEFKRIADLFSELKKRRLPIAIALDEYGGTAGIVTIEDLVEEIVGELRDEYDDDEVEIEMINHNEYLVEAGTRIDMVNKVLKINIETDEFDTIGGYVLGEIGEVGKSGDVVTINDITFKIVKMDKNRILLLRVYI